MTSIDELLESLLYEGYALYPYTPGATKNATPTPFGIVYPPAYAARSGATHDHLQMECIAQGEAPTTVEVFVVFLQASGEGHEAVRRRVDLPRRTLQQLASEPLAVAFDFDSVQGEAKLSARPSNPGSFNVVLRVTNTTRTEDLGPSAQDRAGALVHSLISTHPVLRLGAGRLSSPLEARGCDNVNTWPVLAGEDDTAMIGATIVLPDNPAIAPKSKGNLFDGTEIEEALLLHVQALSDGERSSIAEGDPAVQAMVDRALSVAPEEILDLHGVMHPATEREQNPSAPGPLGPHPERGEKEAELHGRTVRPGAKLILKLEHRADVYDKMLNGRVATLRRIYLDFDDKLYLGVTVDSDPMQQVLGESGRYLFFFPDEVEVLEA